MKVLVTGARGQLGRELIATTPSAVELRAEDVDELDITDSAQVESLVADFRPDLIVNAAAYTAVDAAETDAERCYRVNALGPEYLARAAAATGARLIQISTDFVFDGRQGRPYVPADAAEPLGVYGKTKLEGERRVLDASSGQALVLRTSWLYSAHGKNFVKTMLRLMERDGRVRVVSDQVGTPTWARSLAEAIWAFAGRGSARGVFHFSDAGAASWYDFAVAIAEEGRALGLLDRDVEVAPIRAVDYPTPATRPSFSLLDKTATWAALERQWPHWRVPLRAMLVQLKQLGGE